MTDERDNEKIRTARCDCGALTVTVYGKPARVNICSCEQCQRRSGSVFTYTAFFPRAAATVAGDSRSFHSFSDSGRWQDWHFCPVCGVDVFSFLESMPDTILIRAGCFTDPEFPAPPKFYWASKKHHWLEIPPGVERVETQ